MHTIQELDYPLEDCQRFSSIRFIFEHSFPRMTSVLYKNELAFASYLFQRSSEFFTLLRENVGITNLIHRVSFRPLD
jgi:hypothetical protein